MPKLRKATKQQIRFATPGCSSNALLRDTHKTNRRKSDLYSTPSNRNKTPQTSSNCKEKEVTASSLCFNNFANFGRGDCYNEDTVKTCHSICGVHNKKNLAQIDDNIQDADQCDLHDDSSNCLICGHVQTMKNAKQAASIFQWNTNKNGSDSLKQTDPLAPDSSCADVHLLPIFVLLKLLKFPKEECVNIYKNTFGVLNPADWFILCEKCVKATHQAYLLQVQIRQLEKKFEECQEQFLSQMKASLQSTTKNGDKLTLNILTVREQILRFYSENIQSDSTFDREPDQSQTIDENPCENHLSEPLSSPPQSDSESFEVTLPSPEATRSPTMITSDRREVDLNKKKRRIRIRRKLEAPKRVRNTNFLPKPQRPGADTVRGRNLTMKKNQDEPIAKHTESLAPTTFRCKFCPQSAAQTEFQARTGITHHFAMIHRSMWESVTPYEQCDQCGKSVLAGYSMRQHIQKHHRASCAHICHLCGNRYYTEGALQYHLIMHDRIQSRKKRANRISICDYCGLECKTSDGLNVHIKRFHREGSKKQSTGRAGISSQRKCKHCALVCVNFRELQLHLKSVHPELFKHKCEECDAAYISRSNLQVHVNSIHSQTKLKCKNCPNVLSTAAGMCFHLKYNCRGFSNQYLASDTN